MMRGMPILLALVACVGQVAPRPDDHSAPAAQQLTTNDEASLDAPRRWDPLPDDSSVAAARLVRSLDQLATAAAVRDYLQAGLRDDELRRVGFDQVTLAECVDRAVAAHQEHRQRPGDRLALAALTDLAAEYLSARREAAVRRTAGAQSCLPLR